MSDTSDQPKKPRRVATENVLSYCFTLLRQLHRVEESVHKMETIREQGFPDDQQLFDTNLIVSLSLVESALTVERDWGSEFGADPVAAPLAVKLQRIASDVLMRCSDPINGWHTTKYPYGLSSPPVHSFEPLFIIHLPKVIKELAEVLLRANLADLDAQARIMKLELEWSRGHHSDPSASPDAIIDDLKFQVAKVSQQLEDSRAAVENNADDLMVPVAPKADAVVPAGTSSTGTKENELRRDGETWTLIFEGATARLKDRKGIRYLAYVLQRAPDSCDVSKIESFARSGSPSPTSAEAVFSTETTGVIATSTEVPATTQSLHDDVVDEESLRDYTKEIERLTTVAATARESGLIQSALEAEENLERIRAEQSKVIGLHGKTRHFRDEQDRAAQRIATGIRRAIKVLAEQESGKHVARHLQEALSYGMTVSYRPAVTTKWSVTTTG